MYGREWREAIAAYDVSMENPPPAPSPAPANPGAGPPANPGAGPTTVEQLNTNEPTTTADLRSTYEVVAEFPLKTNVGVSFVLIKGTKEGTQTVGGQEYKLFIQSATDTMIDNEFYTITHSGGIQTSIK
jgi:hypothetical protein